MPTDRIYTMRNLPVYMNELNHAKAKILEMNHGTTEDRCAGVSEQPLTQPK